MGVPVKNAQSFMPNTYTPENIPVETSEHPVMVVALAPDCCPISECYGEGYEQHNALRVFKTKPGKPVYGPEELLDWEK